MSDFAEIKHSEKIKARFLIIDDKQITFMLTDDETASSHDSGIWANTPFFTQALSTMFQNSWHSMKPLKQEIKN